MQIDHSSPIPLHKQIEDYLRGLIESGQYDGGKFLPKEEQMARKFGVSRNTVRQGISGLAQEGLLNRTPGKGTVVADSNITTHLDEWKKCRGVSLKNYSVKVHHITAGLELAEVFQIKEGTLLVKLKRLRGKDKEPFVYFVSWFHPRVGLTGRRILAARFMKYLKMIYPSFPAALKRN